MPFTAGILMVVTGLTIMSFGLFLFYAWLPLLYGFVGFDIGLLLGRSLTGSIGTTAIVLGIVGALAFGAASYFLEPYRRILVGVSGGLLFGLSLAAFFGLDSMLGGFFGTLLAMICGLIGGFLVPIYFDAFVIGISSFAGAVLAMAGANLIFPGLGIFDRAGGGLLPMLLTMILAGTGIGWQFGNLAKWAARASGQDGKTPGS